MSTYRVPVVITGFAMTKYPDGKRVGDYVGGLPRDAEAEVRATPQYLAGVQLMDYTVESTARPSASSGARHLSDSAADCVVYFDGACPLCRREIAHYRGKEGAAAIVWVDAANCDPAALGVDLARDAALARLHARRADGSLVTGVAAFAMIWSRLHAYRWLAPFVSRRPVLTVLEIGYSAFLRLRPLWRRAATPSNALPVAVQADPREMPAACRRQ